VSDYTPTTEEVCRAYTGYTQPSISDSGQLFYGDSAEFNCWLAEVKAQAWEEGALWHRAHGDDRRMRVRFLRDLEVSNPYRQGEKK